MRYMGCLYKDLLLRYAQRFYNHQFVSRTVLNNDILTRFEKLLKDYFEEERQLRNGVPAVQYYSEQLNNYSEQLNMSPAYLSDVIKKATGDTANHYIKKNVIQLAKNQLVSGMNSSEVIYSLGFEHPQHFSRTFKIIT